MSYFQFVVRALDAVKTGGDPMLHAVEMLSAAQTAFTTNGSGSRTQLESASRHLNRLIEWAQRAKVQTDAAIEDCPPMVKGQMRVVEGGKRAPAQYTRSTPTPPSAA